MQHLRYEISQHFAEETSEETFVVLGPRFRDDVSIVNVQRLIKQGSRKHRQTGTKEKQQVPLEALKRLITE